MKLVKMKFLEKTRFCSLKLSLGLSVVSQRHCDRVVAQETSFKSLTIVEISCKRNFSVQSNSKLPISTKLEHPLWKTPQLHYVIPLNIESINFRDNFSKNSVPDFWITIIEVLKKTFKCVQLNIHFLILLVCF